MLIWKCKWYLEETRPGLKTETEREKEKEEKKRQKGTEVCFLLLSDPAAPEMFQPSV